jgi:hypothetical protein
MVSGSGLKGLWMRKSLDPAQNRTMLPRLSSPLPCPCTYHDTPNHVIQYAVLQLPSSTSCFASIVRLSVSKILASDGKQSSEDRATT